MSSGQSFDYKHLGGVWYNELGSTMTLYPDADGGLTGKYNSAVGQAQCYYLLAGRFDAAPPYGGAGVTIGWAVTFRNSKLNAHSTTTWSGQYYSEGEERILTHWLLSRSTLPKDYWNSTNLGTDVFLRHKPAANLIEKALSSSFSPPHPEHVLAKYSAENA